MIKSENADNSILMTPKEAAELANVSTRTITTMCTNGELVAVKLGRQWRLNREKFMQLLGIA